MTVTAMLNVDPASAEAPAPAAPPTADQAQDENDPVPSAVAAEDDPVPVAPTPAPVPRTFNCRAGRENCMVKDPAVAVPAVERPLQEPRVVNGKELAHSPANRLEVVRHAEGGCGATCTASSLAISPMEPPTRRPRSCRLLSAWMSCSIWLHNSP